MKKRVIRRMCGMFVLIVLLGLMTFSCLGGQHYREDPKPPVQSTWKYSYVRGVYILQEVKPD